MTLMYVCYCNKTEYTRQGVGKQPVDKQILLASGLATTNITATLIRGDIVI
jgi:hypothetical protein